jgi:hypothetical protein
MGLLDLPSPILSGIDQGPFDAVPPIAKLVLWAAAGAVLSMEIYRLASSQTRLAEVKAALECARRRVAAFDGPLDEAWMHIRTMLSLAIRRVAMVLPATVLASLPLLAVVIWLDSSYGRAFPSTGESVTITAPEGFRAHWIETLDSIPPRRAQIVDASGEAIADVPITIPISVIHKRRWWNALADNPAGYLADEVPVDRIDIALPRQTFLTVGPDWLRGWEATFFAALVLFALVYRSVRRIA